MQKIAVAGAGFAGSVIAHKLAHAGYEIDVFESRSHIAGNCHTIRDSKTQIMLHNYGPHIFNTNDKYIWDFVNQFDEFMPFINRVKAVANSRVYSFPINLLTINAFYDKTFSPCEAKDFISSISGQIKHPENFEEQAITLVGKDLYETFFKGYTKKQWGMDPKLLPSSIIKRIPVRFNYNDNYYYSTFQGIPRNGYTHVIGNMLKHHNISVHINTAFEKQLLKNYGHLFYSGPIDSWYDFCKGHLGYRTLEFKIEHHKGDYQGNSVINYCDEHIPYTRITEHKHFAPWEDHKGTVIYKEISKLCGKDDIPYYPIRLAKEKTQLAEYTKLANKEQKITFIGRLGTYRYLDMSTTISETLKQADQFIKSHAG